MKKLNRELVILRTFTISTVAISAALLLFAFKSNENKKFGTIDVERINIVESDGTVKMVITNVEQFPNGETKINGLPMNKDRKQRSGMLYFNEDGQECGGFIYDGEKDEKGHSSGLSLTYDRYDGDQVMQLLTTDRERKGRRVVSSSLVFNDRSENVNREETRKIWEEIDSIKDKKARRQKRKEYTEKGLIGATPRIMLGNTRSQNNGLFLFGDDGKPRGMLYVDKDNNVKLNVYNDKGEVTHSWPK
jgi:hypothetical protein